MARTVTVKGAGRAKVKPAEAGVSWQILRKSYNIGIETVFECIDEDIWFGAIEQEIRWRYDAWVHVWMVLLAYGGEIPGKGPMVETFREYGNYMTDEKFDLKKLRDHREYYFGLTKDNYEYVLHIFDKRTFGEVARMWSARMLF